MSRTNLSPRSQSIVQTNNSSAYQTIVYLESRKPNLVFQDSEFRFEISNLHNGEVPAVISVTEAKKRHHRRSPQSKSKTVAKCRPPLSPGSLRTEKLSAEDISVKKALVRSAAILKKAFFAQKGAKRPEVSVGTPSDRKLKMSSEVESNEKTNAEKKQQEHAVRVKSEHKPRSKTPHNGEQKAEGGLKVPESTDKKRRSTETLTAKMDFEDEDAD